jgi:hypothetical protein
MGRRGALHRADAAMYTAKREGRAGPALGAAQRMPSQAARTTRPA